MYRVKLCDLTFKYLCLFIFFKYHLHLHLLVKVIDSCFEDEAVDLWRPCLFCFAVFSWGLTAPGCTFWIERLIQEGVRGKNLPNWLVIILIAFDVRQEQGAPFVIALIN